VAVKSRRKAREAALRALYQMEVGDISADDAIEDVIENAELPTDLAAYFEALVRGIDSNRREIDERISARLVDWDLDRMAAVDRNVLRIAAFELFDIPAIPPAVSIDEAVELAKKFSTADSGRFVNGVLGKLLLDSPKANWNPAHAPEEEPAEEPSTEPEVEEVYEGSPEAEALSNALPWKLRSEDRTA
jgi:N utilization substance protein B